MHHTHTLRSRALVVSASALFAMSSLVAGPLEEYVSKEDVAFSYEVTKTSQLFGVRVYTVRLVSQEWRGKEWKHWLTVFVPPTVGAHHKGILLIEGGTNKDDAPRSDSKEFATIAMSATKLQAPVAVLLQVPSQPLYELYEDDLIAHTFDKYLNGGDDEWPLLLPMVKSATAAMDAIEGLSEDGKLKTLGGKPVTISEFIVGGASKRGWTTWLTAAVDDRVRALAPSVIDVLNMREQMRRQHRTYGGFSEMVGPYTERKIMERLDTPRGEMLRQVVDPFEYRDQLQQPKLILLGTNDPYWIADAAQLYYPHLQGPKAMYYVPNKGHGLDLSVLPTLHAFFTSVLDDKPFPSLETEEEGRRLKVSWQGPGRAQHWSAHSPDRDFRNATWTSRELEGDAEVTLDVLEREAPEDGWRGHFVTVTFPGLRDGDPEFRLSTPIQIYPETFPND